MSSHLMINTSDEGRASLSRSNVAAREGIITSAPPHATLPFSSNVQGQRMRSGSNASSSSSLSIVSPTTSSTSTSASSLHLPIEEILSNAPHSFSSPISPFDETVHLNTEYVLAMHDFAPQQQNATCLSFRAGQVIHVLNRDLSGWWDGELEGRRGWFPSNYVNVDVSYFSEEEPPDLKRQDCGQRDTSAIPWSDPPSVTAILAGSPSPTEALAPEIDLYCPPLMGPLLHGLALLQGAAQSNRITHFQPSTACIISCVRSVLSATECLPREAPLLLRFATLSQERKLILSVLAALVAQAKKASEDTEGYNHVNDVQTMLKLGGQVFSHVRRFLAVAVQCGVELPEQAQNVGSFSVLSGTEGQIWGENERESTGMLCGRAGAFASNDCEGIDGVDGTTDATRPARSKFLAMERKRSTEEERDSTLPLLPHWVSQSRGATLRQRVHRKIHTMSVSSVASSSSFSSLESAGTATIPPFPSGPSTALQVMETLRFTHDQYLSTIAAFIGHAHSHSRSSHASSTGHMYDLVREIVEMVCKLLTIVESVLRHPEMPSHKLGKLKSAKEGLYNVTSALAESVRLLTVSLPPTISEEEEKQLLLRSATGALKAGADCVAAVKMCLNRSFSGASFIIHLPQVGALSSQSFIPNEFAGPLASDNMGALKALYRLSGANVEEDVTIQAQDALSVVAQTRAASRISGHNNDLHPSFWGSRIASPEDCVPHSRLTISHSSVKFDLPSPTLSPTDDGTTWEGSEQQDLFVGSHEDKFSNGDFTSIPIQSIPASLGQDRETSMLQNDYAPHDVAYNSDGHLVGATMEVLVAKMTPHDSIVDPAFSAVFFLTFRLFSSPYELVQAVISRYNLVPPPNLYPEDLQIWQQRKGIPVRLRVSNFLKLWLEMYWRPSVDSVALPSLTTFTKEALAVMFPGPSQRILELIDLRENTSDITVSPKGDRIRDPGMSINPPIVKHTSEIPRPTMTKTLLAALRNKNFALISITDFDALELARQLTVMECNLYCAIQPEEVLETGQEGVGAPVNVRAMSSLSTVITGWVAESILNEHDTKKRTILVKFFIKVADRCVSLNNYSTPRSILAALDSSTISRLHQTWLGLAQKNRVQLDALRRLADHSRNYHEYRTKLRNTAPPAVPFLGLYLTDVTFCREGNPNYRASPSTAGKKLLNFNKYHKLARIVQDMQRFQVPYHLKAIPEVQAYLMVAFNKSRCHGDLQDLYRRSLLVEPRQPADTTPATELRNLFTWTLRSQPQQSPPTGL